MTVKKIRDSGNNEQQVSAEMDVDEIDQTRLQTEPLLDNTILPEIKDRVVFIREGRNEQEHRTIHSRAGKQTRKYQDWFNIIHKKGNIENIDSKLLISWKRDLTESNRVFILQNQTNEKKIKERW